MTLVFLQLPPDMQEKTFAIWRGMANNYDIIDPHDTLKQQVFKHGKNRAKTVTRRVVGNNVRQNFAISYAVAQSLEDTGVHPDNITVIPNQVGGEYNATLRFNQEELIRDKHLSPDNFGVLIVSRVHQSKGLDWLPETIQHLNSNGNLDTTPYKRITIALAGGALREDDPYESALYEQIQAAQAGNDFISFKPLGFQDSQSLQELYCAYDMLYAPSPAEGLPRVLVEGMSSGIVPLANGNCLASAEVIQEPDTEVGLLANSPEESARQLMSIIKQPEKLQEMQHNAAKWATEHYTLEHAQAKLYEALDSYR
jgi:glycosyltransferase involved in cell wall biosynthesis